MLQIPDLDRRSIVLARVLDIILALCDETTDSGNLGGTALPVVGEPQPIGGQEHGKVYPQPDKQPSDLSDAAEQPGMDESLDRPSQPGATSLENGPEPVGVGTVAIDPGSQVD